MKRCSMCQKITPESKARQQPGDPPGQSHRCRDCERHLQERRIRQREYRRKRRMSGWRTVLSPAQKERASLRVAAFYENHWERLQSKIAVGDAVKRGELIIADASWILRTARPFLLKYPFCPLCGRRTSRPNMHGHHYLGYAADKRLDVLFVCHGCHGSITALEREAILQGLPPIAGLAAYIKEKRLVTAKSRPGTQAETVREYNEMLENQSQENEHAR